MGAMGGSLGAMGGMYAAGVMDPFLFNALFTPQSTAMYLKNLKLFIFVRSDGHEHPSAACCGQRADEINLGKKKRIKKSRTTTL